MIKSLNSNFFFIFLLQAKIKRSAIIQICSFLTSTHTSGKIVAAKGMYCELKSAVSSFVDALRSKGISVAHNPLWGGGNHGIAVKMYVNCTNMTSVNLFQCISLCEPGKYLPQWNDPWILSSLLLAKVPLLEEHPDVPQSVPWQIWPAEQRAVWPFWSLRCAGFWQGKNMCMQVNCKKQYYEVTNKYKIMGPRDMVWRHTRLLCWSWARQGLVLAWMGDLLVTTPAHCLCPVADFFLL